MTYFQPGPTHDLKEALSKSILRIEFSYPRKVVLILLDVSVYSVLI